MIQGRTGEVGSNWVWGAGLVGSTAQFDQTGKRIRSNNVNANSYFCGSAQATADGSSCEIEYDIGTSHTGSFGLMVRARKDAGYWALIQSNAVSIRRLNGTSFTANLTLDGGGTTKNLGHATNTSHKARLVATGTGASVKVDFYADDVLICSFTDTSAERITSLGSFGFTCYGGYSDTTGYFLKSIAGRTPAAAATSYKVYGQSSATKGVETNDFISAANGDTGATITVSDNGAGGTFLPSATFLADGGVFTYIPKITGTVTFSFTNNSVLTDATPRNLAVTILPTGVITLQPRPDGQVQRFVGTTTDAETGMYSISRVSGELIIGPIEFSIENDQFEIAQTMFDPGQYRATITVTGSGGTAPVSGLSDFSILGVDGGGDIVPDVSEGAVTLSGASAQQANAMSTGAAVVVGRKARIMLVGRAGAPLAPMTGIKWAWWDQPTPDLFDGPPVHNGVLGVVDPNFELEFDLPKSELAPGGIGCLAITDDNGDPDDGHKAFFGSVRVI